MKAQKVQKLPPSVQLMGWSSGRNKEGELIFAMLYKTKDTVYVNFGSYGGVVELKEFPTASTPHRLITAAAKAL